VKRILSSFLLSIGVIWTLIVGWMYLALSGIAEPISVARVMFYFGGLLVGPLVLIAGSILVLAGRRVKPGSILVIIGCAILTITVGCQIPSMLHDLADPLIVRPPIGLCVGTLVVTLLADAGAVQIFRVARRVSRRLNDD